MSVYDSLESSESRAFIQSDWNPHYDEEGAKKVAYRRKVYECLAEGEKPIRFDTEIIEAAEVAGLSDQALILDIGCSYPFDLARWQEHSFRRGKMFRQFIGIEPNMRQANGLSYWEPQPDTESLDAQAQLSIIKPGKMFRGIQLIKTDANNLLQPPGSVDLAAFNFSFYHVARAKQRAALLEVRRALKKDPDDENIVTGMLALSTSGNDNKQQMRQNELKIAAELSRLRGVQITAPEPLNSGFTTEDAEVLLPQEFKFVYKFEHKTKIVLKNKKEKVIMRKAYRTLLDKYTDAPGNIPDTKIFRSALRAVVDVEFALADSRGERVEDQMSQSAFFASDVELKLPEKFILVGGLEAALHSVA